MAATLYCRNGMTFKIQLTHAADPRPRGYELSICDYEPGVMWSFLSLWKTMREAKDAMDCFARRERKEHGHD